MIKDNDTLVIVNSIEALNEILINEGGMAISSKMIVYLLNRIKEFNEWGQTVILELLSRFKPKTDQELFDIMNLLEDRLKHSCSAIVLGTLKVFMNFTKDQPKIYQQVVERSRSPLITLASSSEISGSYEVTFVVLSHIHFITSKGYSEVFEKDYKIFYCKADEPSYNKFLKLQILATVASESNLGDMLNELGEYVTDVDTELSRRSIAALGTIAVRLPSMTSAIVKQLCSFVSLQKEYITNEVVVVFKGKRLMASTSRYPSQAIETNFGHHRGGQLVDRVYHRPGLEGGFDLHSRRVRQGDPLGAIPPGELRCYFPLGGT
jgi:AP-4 complex subunit beta-1